MSHIPRCQQTEGMKLISIVTLAAIILFSGFALLSNFKRHEKSEAPRAAIIEFKGDVDIDDLNDFIENQRPDTLTLIRVTDESPTKIFGELKAKGSVMIINPKGVVVGPSGIIDLAPAVSSSTLDKKRQRVSLNNIDLLEKTYVHKSGYTITIKESSRPRVKARNGRLVLTAPAPEKK